MVHIDEMKFSSNLNEAIVASLQLGGGESQQELSDFYFPVYSDRRENLDQRSASSALPRTPEALRERLNNRARNEILVPEMNLSDLAIWIDQFTCAYNLT